MWKVRRLFKHKFWNVKSYKKNERKKRPIHMIRNRFRKTGSMLGKNGTYSKHQVLSEENLALTLPSENPLTMCGGNSGLKFSESNRNFNMQMQTIYREVGNAHVILGTFLAFVMIQVGSIPDFLLCIGLKTVLQSKHSQEKLT